MFCHSDKKRYFYCLDYLKQYLGKKEQCFQYDKQDQFAVLNK